MSAFILRLIGCMAIVAGLPLSGFSQECNLTLSGKAVDEHNGEVLSYARIVISDLGKGAISDTNGYYEIRGLCPGTYAVTCTHIGCEPVSETIKLAKSTVHNFYPEHHADLIGTIQIEEKILDEVETRSETILTKKEMDAAKGQSLGDALKAVAGVTTLNTGNSIAKPVIHGLHSNRILIMNNGVRQEGQQWGNEHAPEIDPFIAEQLSVVKGANSVKYGPDAIAGVILVNPRRLRDSSGIGGALNLVGLYNGRQGVASAVIDGNLARLPELSWRVQGTFKRGGNVHAPTYFLKNTGVREYNFSVAAAYKRQKYGLEAFYSQFNTDLGIFSAAHIGNLTDLQRAFEAEVPLESAGFSYKIDRPWQHIEHQLFKVKGYIRTGTVGKLTLTYALQENVRFEFDKHKPRNDSLAALNRPELRFEIATHTGRAVWNHYRRNGFKGEIGITSIYQANIYRGRFFIPNFRKYGAGAFWIERWQPRDSARLELEAGLRYDYIFQQIFMWQKNVLVSPAFNYHNVSGSLGAAYRLTDNWRLRANVGTAWRPPGVNEMFSDGVHHGAAAVEIGDSTLTREQMVSFSLGTEYSSEKLDIFVDAYANYFDNFIYLVPKLPPTLTIRGAFPTFRYQQVEALLAGFDLTVRYRFTPRLEYTAKVATLRARNRNTGEFLVQMPADRFENSLEYKFPDLGALHNGYIAINTVHALRQKRVPPNSDFAAPPDGYNLVGLQAGVEIPFRGQAIDLGLGVQNLLNVSYRDYLNRFRYYANEMGRNISFRLRIPFEILQHH